MHFCTECNNMYYLKIREEDGGLNYYCRNCGNEDTTLTAEAICVSETQLRRSEQKFTHMVNEYTKYDPTLPRIYSMKCPNHECKTNSGSNGSNSASGGGTNDNACEVIYLRYDDENMKYLYICTTCDTSWKTDDDK